MKLKPTVNIETAFDFDLTNGVMAAIRENFGLMGDTDGYKLSHSPMYRKNADGMMSYIESRGGKYDAVMFWGLQLMLLEYFTQRITHKQVDNMKAMAEKYGAPFDEKCWRKVVDVYEGRPPVIIKAVPEGTIVPVKNVLLTIETSAPDPDIFSVVSYFETKLLRIWSPTTVATISYHARQAIMAGLNKTCDDPAAAIEFALNDFGARGTTAMEGAAFSGSGHLANFMGSDNLAAVLATNIAYKSEMSGATIPASEHSTASSWGSEREGIKNLLDTYGAGFVMASVSDTFDIENCIKNIYGDPELKQRIIEQNALLVVRPDSGDPIKMPIQCLIWLDEIFGSTVNKKGFKVLNHVRVIQGDGIDIEAMEAIIAEMIRLGYCVSNMAFGMGAGLLQKNDRDTQKFACKCCAIRVDGVWYDVAKNPVISEFEEDVATAFGYKFVKFPEAESFKKSKAGRMTLIRNSETNEFKTIRVEDLTLTTQNVFRPEDESQKSVWSEVLQVVYKDGDLIGFTTLAEGRERAHSGEKIVKAA
jgi:nicotinamide phosphoribosyltransferase